MLINPSNKMEPGKQRKQQNRYADLKHFNCWNVPFQPSRIVLCIHESGKPTFCCMDTNYRASFPFADIFNELKLKKHIACLQHWKKATSNSKHESIYHNCYRSINGFVELYHDSIITYPSHVIPAAPSTLISNLFCDEYMN